MIPNKKDTKWLGTFNMKNNYKSARITIQKLENITYLFINITLKVQVSWR